MRALARPAALALTALVLATTSLSAEAYRNGWHGRGYWHGGVRVGIGIGFAPWYYGGPYGYYPGYYGYYPGYVLAAPTPIYPVAAAPAEPAPRAAPDPVYYPRTGQSPAQTEADVRDCNRWAMTQPSAMSDASVFKRATAACMDGRGYTVR